MSTVRASPGPGVTRSGHWPVGQHPCLDVRGATGGMSGLCPPCFVQDPSSAGHSLALVGPWGPLGSHTDLIFWQDGKGGAVSVPLR